jgi:TolA-binding protein
MLIKSILKTLGKRLLIVNLRYLFQKAEESNKSVAKQRFAISKGLIKSIRVKISKRGLLIIILAASGILLSAQDAVTSLSDRDRELFNQGKDLFEKEKYGAAIVLFDRYVGKADESDGLSAREAEYMSALSSIRLYNRDAEHRLETFIAKYPQSYMQNNLYMEMADQFYQSRNYRRAEYYYNKVDRITLEPEILPGYFFRYGYSLFMNGDNKRAMLFFSEIMGVDTEFTPPAIYYFSHIAYSGEMYLTALDGFKRLEGDETFGQVVPFYIVQIMYVLGDYDGILRDAPALVDAAGEERAAELYQIIGDAYFQKGDYVSAARNLEEHISRAVRTGREGKYQLAYCYYQTEEYEKAVPLFKEVSRQRDRLGQNAYYLLGDTYIRQGEKKLAQAAFSVAAGMDYDRKIKEESLFNFAKLTYETTYSPFGEVIRAFQDYIEQFPASDNIEEAYEYLVSAYMKVNNYSAAVTSLDRITIKDERLERAYQKVALYRGMELFSNLDMVRATAMFDRSLKYGRYDRMLRARALYWKGEALYRQNDPEGALAAWEEFIALPGSDMLDEYNKVRYNMGYVAYNRGRYEEALRWFIAFESDGASQNSSLLPDLYNRIADCHYIATRYDRAIEYYNRVIARNGQGADYAMFQKGFALGLQNDASSKASVLSDLIAKYPNSSLIPKALFERGRAWETLNNPSRSEDDFNRIISDYTESTFVPRAMVQLGLLYFNTGDNNRAISTYKKVVESYPGTPEARSAMTGLRTTYVEINDVETYFAYVRSLDGYGDVRRSEQDSLLYASGENLYATGNCERATEVLTSYLNQFPQGSFSVNARFYLAECYRTSGNTPKALAYYTGVASTPNNPFIEQTYVSLADIYYTREVYDSAFYYFDNLAAVAGNDDTRLRARQGRMRSAWEMGDPVLTIRSADELLKADNITGQMVREAAFMKAKSYYALDNFDNALAEFRKVATEQITSEGAESKYRVAEILFNRGDADQAGEMVYSFIEDNTPHQYWMARMFILLADISISRDDEFQARTTLQSLADFYQVEDDGILDEVRARLSDLDASQRQVNDTIRMTVGEEGK